MAKNSDTYGIFDAYRNVLIKEAVKPTEENELLTTQDEIDSAKLAASTIINRPQRERLEKLIADSEKALQGKGDGLPTNADQTDNATLQAQSPQAPDTSTEIDPDLANILKPLDAAPVTQQASQQAAVQGRDYGDRGYVSQSSPSSTSQQEIQTSPEQQVSKKTTPTQSGSSIVDYLASTGQKSDFASRSKLAAENGIENYKGTAQQNLDLLRKLQSGEKPSTETQQKTTPESGGMSKAIGGAGNVIKKGLIGSEAPLGGALGAASKSIGGAGNIAKGAVGGASKAIGGAGNLVKKGLIGSEAPLGGALGAVSKGLGSVGNVAKNAGNIAKGAVGGASKAIGGAGNLAKQGLTGQKEPMGGILGGISKGLGSIGNVAKRAVGGGTKEEEEEIKENKNISQFLKSLNNKDYHQANIHLKEIIESKFKRKLQKSIK